MNHQNFERKLRNFIRIYLYKLHLKKSRISIVYAKRIFFSLRTKQSTIRRFIEISQHDSSHDISKCERVLSAPVSRQKRRKEKSETVLEPYAPTPCGKNSLCSESDFNFQLSVGYVKRTIISLSFKRLTRRTKAF